MFAGIFATMRVRMVLLFLEPLLSILKRPGIKMLKYILLYVLGLICIASLYWATLPVPAAIQASFSETQFKILALVNPVILLVLVATWGHVLAPKLGLTSFMFNVNTENARFSLPAIIFALILTLPAIIWCDRSLSQFESQAKISIPLITRILYGGIFEELVVRWGVVSLLLWLLTKIGLSPQKLLPILITLIFSSLLFGLGHIGIARLIYGPNLVAQALVIGGNFIAGIAAGWLFCRYSLEEAIVYHMILGVGIWASIQLS